MPAADDATGNAPKAFGDLLFRDTGSATLTRDRPTTVQINVGKRCNQACHHCHVDAGPKRTESMPAATATRVLDLIASDTNIDTVDITGGAPELNPGFRHLVSSARASGRRVIDRCNLTILLEPGQEDLARFLATEGVDLVCSLPCYGADNVDKQRGAGVFDKSIEALRKLNALGYGLEGSPLVLDLVYNPLGASLPPPQATLEAKYRDELRRQFGVEFHRLLTITNMPIQRFADQLKRWGEYDRYMSLLVNHFNPSTLPGLMCRSLVSIGWDGRLHDCDFNQMLDLPLGGGRGPLTVFELESFEALRAMEITTGPHCFGCTAGSGSSCSGAVVS